MKVLKEEPRPYGDKVYVTPRGNVFGIKHGTNYRPTENNDSSPSIALVAHIDSLGFLVSYIEKSGFIRFRKLGGPVDRANQGQQVRLIGKCGSIIGVVGMKPNHITTPEEARAQM